MDKANYEWDIKSVKFRYHYLALTSEQAEQIHLSEQVIKEPASREQMTDWEELDFELATMQRVLSEEQLTLYLPEHTIAVEEHSTQLREWNAAEASRQEYHREMLRYFQETILPTLYAEPVLLRSLYMVAGKHRLQFVEEEYKRHLRREWKKIVTQHYRTYRSFGPDLLELQRLQHELLTVWPDARSVAMLDKPVRAVVKALLKETDYLLDPHDDLLKKLDQERGAFLISRWEQHFGPLPTRGLIHYETISEKQVRRQWLFRLLWLSGSILTRRSGNQAGKKPGKKEG